jgi:hypothetical protein
MTNLIDSDRQGARFLLDEMPHIYILRVAGGLSLSINHKNAAVLFRLSSHRVVNQYQAPKILNLLGREPINEIGVACEI